MIEQVNIYAGYLYSYPHKTAYRNFATPVPIAEYIPVSTQQNAQLYFHIPYCNHKCGFCNLFSKQGYNEGILDHYLATLHKQAEQVSALTQKIQFSAFAIGGGTPLVLTPQQLSKLFTTAELFGVDPAQVFTSIETSPEESQQEKLLLLKEIGVSRISIGIQSFITEELLAIKRRTPLEQLYRSLETIRQLEFNEFNIDMIYGIAGQTEQSLLASIQQALHFAPSELFLYPLYVRPETLITQQAAQADTLRMYQAARERLLAEGYCQTSMRRFVKQSTPDLEFSCGDETMISCGCGGRSYLGPLHFAENYAVHPKGVHTILENYLSTSDFTQAYNGILLSPEELKIRYLIKNLLYYQGVCLQEYAERYQSNPVQDVMPLSNLIEVEFLQLTTERLRLTEKGMAYSDYIGQLLISPAIRQKMNTYAN